MEKKNAVLYRISKLPLTGFILCPHLFLPFLERNLHNIKLQQVTDREKVFLVGNEMRRPFAGRGFSSSGLAERVLQRAV